MAAFVVANIVIVVVVVLVLVLMEEEWENITYKPQTMCLFTLLVFDSKHTTVKENVKNVSNTHTSNRIIYPKHRTKTLLNS